LSLKILKKLKTASHKAEFTGSYKEMYYLEISFSTLAKTFLDKLIRFGRNLGKLEAKFWQK